MTPANSPRRRQRLNPTEIEARIRAILILTLAGVLGLTVLGMLYSLIFVYQPEEAAPLDLAFMDVLSPLSFSIGGALTGLAAGGAAKKIANRDEDE